MKRPEANSDLRKANDHMDRKRRRRAHYRARTQHVRDRRRQLALLMAGINRGWIG
jgi:hypothetical protein